MALEKLPALSLDLATQVRLLVSRFGADTVRDAVNKATKGKRGRKAEKDGPHLTPYIRMDAIDWLEGRDPFTLRKNYAVAKKIAEEHPGHSAVSTHARIERKLKKSRRWFMLVRAHEIAQKEYPFATHLRALDALRSADGAHEVWEKIYKTDSQAVVEYRTLLGEPDSEMTFDAIEAAIKARRDGWMTIAELTQPRKGLFGGGLGGILGLQK